MGIRADGTIAGNPRKTIRIADAELRTWLEEKAKAEGVTETEIILDSLRVARLFDTGKVSA